MEYWRDYYRKELSKSNKELLKEKALLEKEIKSADKRTYNGYSTTIFNKAKLQVVDSMILDRNIKFHISAEKWNTIPRDYKCVDAKTGKKMAFAGSLGLSSGGTTLLTEGKHFIIYYKKKRYKNNGKSQS